MRKRYIEHMNNIHPSHAFVSQLEREMNRQIERKASRQRTLSLALTAVASIAILAIVFFGILPARLNTDVVAHPGNTFTPSATFTPAPTDEPTSEPTIEPTSVPTPEPSAAAVYPPDDERLEIEMGDRKVFGNALSADDFFNVLFSDDYLVGAQDSYLVELHQGNELNSVVVAPLRPGDAYWPIADTDYNLDNFYQLTDEKGNEVGYAERVQYYDEASNTVKTGWKHKLYDMTPPEVSEIPIPVERVQIPGEVRSDNTPLRYGKSADAPAITTFDKGQLISIGYRVGNWLYVSNDPYNMGGEIFTGWMHVTEVLGADWRAPLNRIDLLADSINLRDKPDGKIIGSLNKDSVVYYAGDTVPGKNGDWHFVTANWLKDTQTGYISADYAKLYTFRLESELDLSGVVSATLRCPGEEFNPVEQTIDGEQLALLLDRLKNACSRFVYTPVCGDGSSTITLVYADGSEIVLPISADSCTYVRYGAVTYDLKTDAERAECFLNDGGVGLSDILSPIFDQIQFP